MARAAQHGQASTGQLVDGSSPGNGTWKWERGNDHELSQIVTTILIAPEPASAPVTTIDAQPIAELERFDADGYHTDEHGRPVFDPARPHR